MTKTTAIKKTANTIFYSLPLRDLVVFPGTTATILVGRNKSINSVNQAKESNSMIFTVAQIKPDKDIYSINEVYEVGTLCQIVSSTKTVEGNLKLVIQGIRSVKIKQIIDDESSFLTEIVELPLNQEEILKESSILLDQIFISFAKYAKYNKNVNIAAVKSLSKIKEINEACNIILAFLECPIKTKQQILEENNPNKKIIKVYEALHFELNALETEEKIAKKIQNKIISGQKNIYLHEQLKHIKQELGEEENEAEELRKKLKKLKLSKEIREKCQKEISKFEKSNPASSEAGVIRNYIDLILSLPWDKKTKENQDLEKTQKILDQDHFGLEKVKERILELIAVQIKTKSSQGSVICLVGPPGVGKTSLARSIAKSLNRKYVKVSLGGVKDESEIRGHRRTYIGAMPGKIINSIKKYQSNNPVMLLDEIDKMSHDMRGDPASAMLEVLDPEQNNAFNDHYLEVDYDLSNVMFIATANSADTIPAPLKDRMEVIRLSGYSENEKLKIAKDYLIEKERKKAGLKKTELKISNDALLEIIRKYTFEAGVRNLTREIAKIARKTTRKIINKEKKSIDINPENLKDFSGISKFDYGLTKENNEIGISTGLAYTQMGGDLLDIEAVKFEGEGKVQTTGKLGEVMNESTKIALSYIRSIAPQLNIAQAQYNKYDFHIHFPEGATPKDGPSAGVAICLALASCITGMAVDKNVAVTGEVTLNGKVLPIGGLKEKLLAALRGKITKVLIPKKNEKDLEEMPQEILENLTIKPIATVKEAFKEALVGYNELEKNKDNPISNIDNYSKNNESVVIESGIIT